MPIYTSARGDAKAAPDFLSTHPATPSRIARAVREARQFGAPGIGEQDRDAYLAKLDGMLYGDDPLQGFVRGRSFLHKALGIGFTVPDGFTLENTPQAVLASDGKGTALRFDGAELASSESLSDYISSGWINGLVENSIRQTTVNGLPAITATALAEGWSFRIGLVRKGETVYRFILATREPTESFLTSFDETLKSFRQLSLTEQARLRPLTIRIVTISGWADGARSRPAYERGRPRAEGGALHVAERARREYAVDDRSVGEVDRGLKRISGRLAFCLAGPIIDPKGWTFRPRSAREARGSARSADDAGMIRHKSRAEFFQRAHLDLAYALLGYSELLAQRFQGGLPLPKDAVRARSSTRARSGRRVPLSAMHGGALRRLRPPPLHPATARR